MTTRLAINATQTARVRRETYIGPWLPEPVDTSADPTLGAERGEALELAMLVLLEKLSPTQRAAYILREAFDYPYDQIAEIVQVSEANVRQLVSRSRKRLADERREPVSSGEERELLTAFMAAAREGDFAKLVELLSADVVSYSDGGGIVRATRYALLGAEAVAKVTVAFSNTPFWTDADFTWLEANGRTTVVASRDGKPYVAVSVSASEGRHRPDPMATQPGEARRHHPPLARSPAELGCGGGSPAGRSRRGLGLRRWAGATGRRAA